MSRARLGLYVFARTALFQNCYELTPTFNIVSEFICYCLAPIMINLLLTSLMLLSGMKVGSIILHKLYHNYVVTW